MRTYEVVIKVDEKVSKDDVVATILDELNVLKINICKDITIEIEGEGYYDVENAMFYVCQPFNSYVDYEYYELDVDNLP